MRDASSLGAAVGYRTRLVWRKKGRTAAPVAAGVGR
jgi:hypothetical protein